MNEITNKNLPWSIYWAQDRLHSCVASNSNEDQKIFEELWQDFVEPLDQGSKVLDLATGNGAVPFALLSARPDLMIDAVDKAQIDPLHFLSKSNLLSSVSFHSETDLASLPFELESFVALTSQFGIEYAGLKQAVESVFSYLQRGGSFQFIVHSVDSDIIQSSKLKIRELGQLVEVGGLLDILVKVIQSEEEFSSLEEVGKQYLDSDNLRTEALSGQVFSAIGLIREKMVTDPNEAINRAMALDLRVRSEHSRLLEMSEAAQSEQEMKEIVDDLKKNMVEVTVMKPIYIDQDSEDYLLGWLIKGQKS